LRVGFPPPGTSAHRGGAAHRANVEIRGVRPSGSLPRFPHFLESGQSLDLSSARDLIKMGIWNSEANFSTSRTEMPICSAKPFQACIKQRSCACAYWLFYSAATITFPNIHAHAHWSIYSAKGRSALHSSQIIIANWRTESALGHLG